MTQSIYRHIAHHAAAVARLEEAPDSYNEDGTINAIFSSASDDEERALINLIAARPRTTVELHRKAGYLLLHMRHTETLDRESVEALLSSLTELRLQSA